MIVEPDANQLVAQTEVFHYTLAPVPEPETYALMVAGLVFVAAWSRRRAV